MMDQLLPSEMQSHIVDRIVTGFLLWLSMVPVVCFASETVHIELKNGTDSEHQTQAQLEKLLRSYDLTRYTFTRNVVIDGWIYRTIGQDEPKIADILQREHLGLPPGS